MIYNDIFDYSDGHIYWKPRKERGFSLSGKKAGTLNKGYEWVRGKYFNKVESVHRIVWQIHNGEIPDGFVVDHINRNGLDNRIENLRLATRSENSMNAKGKSNRKPSALPKNVYVDYVYNGVTKYRAQICKSGVVYRDGPHETIESASFAAEKMRQDINGKFACNEK